MPAPSALWLSNESADVFELFVLWLHRRHAFRAVVDSAVTILEAEAQSGEMLQLLPPKADRPGSPNGPNGPKGPKGPRARSVSASLSDLHWHLVDLHMFAAFVQIPALQDVVMDTLQDLYLRLNWAATPALLRFLYVDADDVAACRLRKWAVALLGWTLANAWDEAEPADGRPAADAAKAEADGQSSGRNALLALLDLPALAADYDAHQAKMCASRADARIKNPQLRIPSNQLRREDRHFGFRQCSFHSHRRVVGEGRCPHERHERHERMHAARRARKAAAGEPERRRPPPPLRLRMPLRMPTPSSPSDATVSDASETPEEPQPMHPGWPSEHLAMAPGYAPLGMESTI